MSLNALIADDNLEQQCNDVSDFDKTYWESMKNIGSHGISPKIEPSDIVFIQVRDFEKPEEHLVKKHNIRSFFPKEVAEIGISKVLVETLSHLSDCDLIYVSFDVDSQDTSISVGTGTPVPNGLNKEQSEEIFTTLFNHPKVAAFEITEINPLLDTENHMAKAVLNLLQKVL